MKTALVTLGALLVTSCQARDLSKVNPPFPRLGNCYGSGLGWASWERGKDYWSKVDLFIGGGYDVHYDWDSPRWTKTLATYEQNLKRILEVNPHALFLPYVDVIEGPYDPKLPAHWWDLRDGKRWSGWPGMDRINTKLPEVLQFNLDRTRTDILGRPFCDGVFYDCWGADDWLVPRTAQLRDGQAIVMINDWNLPTKGFRDLNGCLAEDEVNRIIAGKVDFAGFLARYLRWSNESRKPAVTMLVCCPKGLDGDVWGFHKLSREDRQKAIEQARQNDQRTMRFGLALTLMGDGYFGFDAANMGRGTWWWYPEFDAPLGYPKGPAKQRTDGLWQREFDGGTVLVNGSRYDAAVELPGRMKDVSTKRVGTRFTLPMMDGRIYLPSTDAPSAGDDQPPRLTRERPRQVRAAPLDDQVVVQTPGGLDLWFEATGELKTIVWRQQTPMTGGWPMVAAPPFRQFESRAVAAPEVTHGDGTARLVFRSQLTHESQRVALTTTCTVTADERFTLRFDYTAETALDLRLWRHYFAFPVAQYGGGSATADGKSVTLPATFGTDALLPGAQRIEVAGPAAKVSIDSSLPLALVDHRRYNAPEYLLAGYPLSGKVPAGQQGTVAIRVGVAPAR